MRVRRRICVSLKPTIIFFYDRLEEKLHSSRSSSVFTSILVAVSMLSPRIVWASTGLSSVTAFMYLSPVLAAWTAVVIYGMLPDDYPERLTYSIFSSPLSYAAFYGLSSLLDMLSDHRGQDVWPTWVAFILLCGAAFPIASWISDD